MKTIKPHYESTPIQIYWKILPQKKKQKKPRNFSDKNSDIFHISA